MRFGHYLLKFGFFRFQLPGTKLDSRFFWRIPAFILRFCRCHGAVKGLDVDPGEEYLEV